MGLNANLSLQGATLSNATVNSLTSGTSVQAFSSTLDGVTLNADMSVVYFSAVTVQDGLTLNANITVTNINYSTTTLDFVGNQSLSGTGSILLNHSNAQLYAESSGGSNATLTIGSGITIHGLGSINEAGNTAIVNQGTIIGDTGNTLSVDVADNQGTIEATNGTLNLGTGNWTNTSNISVSGGTLNVNGNWTSTGNLGISGGTLNLNGNFVTAALANVSNTGGTLNLNGTLDNTGSTWTLGTSGVWTLGGTIKGGTITSSASGTWLKAFFNATLDGVTLNADMSFPYYSTLTIKDGLTLNANLTVNNIFSSSTLDFVGTQTLSGTGTVVLANYNANVSAENAGSGTGNLTIGSGITIQGFGTIAPASTGSIVNEGTILTNTGNTLYVDVGENSGTIEATSGTLTVGTSNWTTSGNVSVAGGTLNVNGNWTNTGNISISAGTLNLNGNFVTADLANISNTGGTLNLNGTLDNAGSTWTLGTSGVWTLGGTILGGTIAASSSGTWLKAFYNATLDGVTLNTDLGFPYYSTLTIKDGLTLNANLTINNTYSYSPSTLDFVGTQTLSGTGEVILTSSNAQVSAENAGSGTGTLTIGSGITIAGYGSIIPSSTGLIVNEGTILGNTGNTLYANVVNNQGIIGATNGTLNLGTANWTNSGNISVSGGTLNVNGNWTNTGNIGVSGGTLNLNGNFATAALANISNTGGTLNLNGTLNNTGSTWTLGTSGVWTLGGTILGGTIAASASGTWLIAFYNATLDGVTLNTNLSFPYYSTLTIKDGLTLNANLTINNTYSYVPSTLDFVGTQTLGGTGTVVLANYNADVSAENSGSGTGTLTIGSGVTIQGFGTIAPASTGSIVNEGTILSNTSGNLFVNIADNQGTIEADSGNVSLGSGNWTNSGTVNGTGGNLTLNGNWTNSGTIKVSTGVMSSSGSSWTNTGVIEAIGEGIFNAPNTTVSGIGQVLGGTEIGLSWQISSTANGTTTSLQQSENGSDYVAAGSVDSSSSGYFLNNLELSTPYTFRINSVSTGGGVLRYQSDEITTASNDQSGWYRVAGLTDSNGTPVTSYCSVPDGYITVGYDWTLNTQSVFAGSEWGALAQVFSGLISLDQMVPPIDSGGGDAEMARGIHAELDLGGDSPSGFTMPAFPADGVTVYHYYQTYSYGDYNAKYYNIWADLKPAWYPILPGGTGTSFQPTIDVMKATVTTAGKPASGPSPLSTDPIRYSDGSIQYQTTDLSGNGFALTRSWTNQNEFVTNGTYGQGVIFTGLKSIEQIDGDQTIAVIASSTDVELFNLDAATGEYTSELGIDHLAHTGDEYIFTDTAGTQTAFNDFSSDFEISAQGQFVSQVDVAGNSLYVASETDAGQIQDLRYKDASGTDQQSWLFTYLSDLDANAGLLSNVQQRSPDGTGGWTIDRQVAYTYYDGTNSNGNLGDLEFATIEDGAGSPISTDYYRYYTPGEANGYTHALKYVVDATSYARLVGAVGDLDTASDASVAAYAAQYFQYDSERRVIRHDVQGAGTSTSGGIGSFTYEYVSSSNMPGMNSWATKTTETLPDGNQNIVYANYLGEVMLKVFNDISDPADSSLNGKQWDTFYKYDSQGRDILEAAPSAVTGYDDAYADLLHAVSGNYAYLADSAGLITLTSYFSSTTATATTAGGVANYVANQSISNGELGTPVPQVNKTYFSVTAGGITVDPDATLTVYRNTDGTGAETTSYAYTWFTGTTQMASMTTSAPIISADQNGPGTADTSTIVYNGNGQPIWTKDAGGFISYAAYDPVTGAVVKSINDVDTTDTSEFSDLPSGWATPTGGGLNLVTTYVVDGLGRTTKETDPNGNVTFIVYNDANHESRIYRGWNATTLTTTGPIEVIRDDYPGSYTEDLTMAQTPHTTDGVPDGTESIGNVQTLARNFYDNSDQLVRTQAYFNLTGLTYSTAATLGTAGTSYYVTSYGYDSQGYQSLTVDATGTIAVNLYDGLGRLSSTYVGTNDSTTDGHVWTPADAGTGSNMVLVAQNVYDGGNVGDGDLTQSTTIPGGGQANQLAQYDYNWRDELVATKMGASPSGTSAETDGVNRPITVSVLDNLGEVTAAYTFDGDGVSMADTNDDGVPDALASDLVAPGSSATGLVAYTTTSYDDQGRVYESTVYSVDPSTGTISTTGIVTNIWYDHRGEVIKTSTSGSAVTKTTYDGAGRATAVYTTDGGGDTSWADALNVTSDTVLEQIEYTYDADGNVIETTDRQRFSDASGTGALGDPASTTQPKARVYYTVSYYDAINCLTATADIGTNGGTAYTRASSAPARSDTTLVTSYTYNAAGWLDTLIDPKGISDKSFYDNLGRVIISVAAWSGTFDPTEAELPSADDEDQTTEYTYDGDGHTLTMTAVMPSGEASQTTQYIYGVTTGQGSAIDSNDLLQKVEYPNASTGAASTTSSGQNTFTYNALGQTLTKTDQNGTTQTYSYDVLGRQTLDSVTTLASGIDGSIRSIGTTYNPQGLVATVTSYSTTAANPSDIVNQIEDLYNGFGQLTREYQSTSGAVNTDTTPSVQYAYGSAATGSRLTSMTYPNGTVLTYSYGTTGSLNDTISRLDSLVEGSQTIESYQYLGLSTVVVREQPQAGMELTYIQQSGDTSTSTDGGDQYVGLDRFGRVIDQNWISTSDGSTLDRYQYAYDRDSNVVAKNNLLDSGLNETYTYDDLGRLTDMTRGGSDYQSWNLDAVGNMDSVTTGGTTTDNTTNAQNELTGLGSATLAYDNNGNTTTDDQGHTLVYDAWNRLISVSSGGTTIASYSYDGIGRQVTQTTAAGTTDLYYSSQWQVIEERQGGQTTAQEIWSPVYVNALILKDSNTTGNPATDGLNQRLYATQDANYNVTSYRTYNADTGTTTTSLRMVYDSYGNVKFYTNAFASTTNSLNVNYLYQGGRYDASTGLYVFEHREYSPTMMRWMQQDPLGYVNGANDYGFVTDNPGTGIDPTGEVDWPYWRGFAVSPIVAIFSPETAQAIGNGDASFVAHAIAHPLNTLYTGDPSAYSSDPAISQSNYDAGVTGAGAWQVVNSPLKGFYGYAGIQVIPKPGGSDNSNGPQLFVGVEGQWTVDNGYSGGVGVNFLGSRGGVSGGVAGGYYWGGGSDGGWWAGLTGTVGRPGSDQSQNIEGYVDPFQPNPLYLGLGAKFGGAGLIIDPSKLPNLLTPNARDGEVDDLIDQFSPAGDRGKPTKNPPRSDKCQELPVYGGSAFA